MIINYYLFVFLISYIPLVTLFLYKDFKAQRSHPMDYVMSFLLSGGISLFFLFVVDALGEDVFRIFGNLMIIIVLSAICFFFAKFLNKKIFTNVDK